MIASEKMVQSPMEEREKEDEITVVNHFIMTLLRKRTIVQL